MNKNSDFKYDANFSHQQKTFAMIPEMVSQRQKIHECLKLQSGENVLDIGSGNGFMVAEMADGVGTSGKLVGIDISLVMVDMAAELCRRKSNAEFIQANAIDLPFPNGTFDVVTTSQCLCFVSNIDVAMAEIVRVLKPGGRVVILDTDWDSLVWHCKNRLLMDKIMSWYLNKIYVDAHLPRTLSNRINHAGLYLDNRSSFPIINWSHNANTFAGLQIEFVRSMINKGDQILKSELQEWVSDLENIANSDECFFSLNRYIFCATKP